MGSPKPLLPFRESTFLGHLMKEFRASRAEPVVVVLGHEADRIRSEVVLSEARLVINADYRRGMLSSIRAGLDALSGEDVDGVLVCPVDHPMVDSTLIDELIERFEETRRPVVLPVHRGKRGHPVLFSQSVFDDLKAAPDALGARKVVWDHADEVLEVVTQQSGAGIDIDTPEEYRQHIAEES